MDKKSHVHRQNRAKWIISPLLTTFLPALTIGPTLNLDRVEYLAAGRKRERQRERGGGVKELLTSQLENPERLYPIGSEYTLFFQLPLEYN